MDDAARNDKPPAVSVCVIAYNSGGVLADCLESLEAQTFRDFETIVIDNGSPDPRDRPVAEAATGVSLAVNAENLGFAGAGNQGARLARGRWYVLLNADAAAEPRWLDELMAAAARWPQVKAFTSRQLMADDPTRLDGLGDVMSGYGIPYRGGYMGADPGDTADGEVFSPCGAAMMIDRELFLGMGGFDERFFCYVEDVDLGYRLRLAGHATVVAPRAVVHHVGSASTGGRRSEFAVFHGTRNRFWMVFKDTPSLLLPLVLPLHFASVVYITLRGPNRPQAGIVWRAFKAALAGLPGVLKSRAAVQGARKASAWSIARAMTWNPADLHERRPVIRPLKPAPPPTR